jgi:A/G-specific adenine glycosylase
MNSDDLTKFRRTVWNFYRKSGRHDLPWRKTRDPYKILVSEVMLQQTQVERVIPFYRNFLKRFPTPQSLAEAPLADVLAAWQGLGYNRRAKLLREAARELASKPHFVTRFDLVKELEELPGVGPYTARAVAAFAFNADTVFIETNIRTVIIHRFFSGEGTTPYGGKVPDKEIEAIVAASLPKGRAREWYGALMDYGTYLKRSGVRVNARSAGYVKQAKFEGSVRQVRGAILAAVTSGKPLAHLHQKFPDRFDMALAGLAKDGMIAKKGKAWRVA